MRTVHSSSIRSNSWRRTGLSALALSAVLGSGALSAQPAHAAKPRPVMGIEPWPGRRVLLLLPLQLGEGFNADKNFGRLILPRAEAQLAEQLEKTGKFSVIRAHNFSPLIQRALQEKRLTPAQVEEATKEPTTLDSAKALLSQFVFDQEPMIAEFHLEEVRAGGTATLPSVQAQVSGRLYSLTDPTAMKSPVVTSNSVKLGGNNIERYLGAATDAFAQISTQFTAPLEDIELPRVEPAPDAKDGAKDGKAGMMPNGTMPEGAMPAAGTPAATPATAMPPAAGALPDNANTVVPQLPAAQPPLGVAVPNSPTAAR